MQNVCVLPEGRVLQLLSRIESSPAVFLETTHFSKENHTSFVFRRPQKILSYHLGQNLEDFFKEVQCCTVSGLWVAGYFTYEFGYLFEPSLSELLRKKRINFPLAWLGVFKAPRLSTTAHSRRD